jgi:hypothetical protein
MRAMTAVQLVRLQVLRVVKLAEMPAAEQKAEVARSSESHLKMLFQHAAASAAVQSATERWYLWPPSHKMVTMVCPGPSCLATLTAPTQFVAADDPTNRPS